MSKNWERDFDHPVSRQLEQQFWEHTIPVSHLIPLPFWRTGIPDMIPTPSDIPDIFPMKRGELNWIKCTQM